MNPIHIEWIKSHQNLAKACAEAGKEFTLRNIKSGGPLVFAWRDDEEREKAWALVLNYAQSGKDLKPFLETMQEKLANTGLLERILTTGSETYLLHTILDARRINTIWAEVLTTAIERLQSDPGKIGSI